MDIRNFDLNLLPVLDALLRHQSVTIAARELGMSQSALSSALTRLRILLGDDLLVRTGRGMRPTARAIEISTLLSGLLEQVRDNLLTRGSFNPADSSRRISLRMSDVGSFVLWPRIVSAVRQHAPKIELVLGGMSVDAIDEALERGEADLALGTFHFTRASIFQRRLYERSYVCLAAANHPLAGRELSLSEFAEAPHLVVRTPARIHEMINEDLAAQGLARSNAMEVPSYLVVPPLLETGNYVSVMPGQLADAYVGRWDLVRLHVPIALPVSTIRIFWHRRCHGDPAIMWLRDMIARDLMETDAA